MKAEIMSVGTEILLGSITDTNATYLAQQFQPLGIDLYYVSAVGDNLGRLSETLRRAFDRSDLVVITGGLGPTEDDLTREAIAAVLGEEMVVQPDLERTLLAFFAARGVQMPERNVKQATLIPSARALLNPIGTAPGWWVEKDGRVIVAMPGVPVEMRRMWEHEAAPRLRERTGGVIIHSKTLKIIGMGESLVEHSISSLLASNNPTLATYAKQDGVHVRITAKAASVEEAEALIAAPEARVREILGATVYGVDAESLEGVVGAILRETGLTLATMEGCTAGMLSAAITNIPGSSAYFRGGSVVYSPEAKVAAGIEPALLEQNGLVAPEIAWAMATMARKQLGADIGIGLTGVAGPEPLGDVPAGTFHVAVDNRGAMRSESFHWSTTRGEIRRRAVMNALALLRKSLLEV